MERKNIIFRLRTDLIERMKELAASDSRDLNDYVETILMNAAFSTPNPTSIAAMKEAEDDSTLTTVNMDSYDSFVTSLTTE